MERAFRNTALFLLLVVTAILLRTTLEIYNMVEPRSVLVGTGCEGPSPIRLAFEEDDLPVCEAIERHDVAVGG